VPCSEGLIEQASQSFVPCATFGFGYGFDLRDHLGLDPDSS